MKKMVGDDDYEEEEIFITDAMTEEEQELVIITGLIKRGRSCQLAADEAKECLRIEKEMSGE